MESKGIAPPFYDHGNRRGEGSASRPGRSLPPGKTRYPLYRRLGGPQDRSGQVRKISYPPGFDPPNVQPVASRYTDYATRSTQITKAFRYIPSKYLLTDAIQPTYQNQNKSPSKPQKSNMMSLKKRESIFGIILYKAGCSNRWIKKIT
jgi:hypothetical protein